MKSKTIIARILIAASAVAASVAASAAPPAAPPPGGAPSARVLIIDIRRAIGESKVGKDIQRQAEALQQQITNELKGQKASLENEKRQLDQQTAIMAADIRARRAREFEAKVKAFQERVQKRGTMLEAGMYKAQAEVQQALGPILQGIMRERGATILMDRTAIMLAPNTIDVTQVATQRLDMKMTTMKVELIEPPAAPERR